MGLFVYWSAFEKTERQAENPVKPAILAETTRRQNREKRLTGGRKTIFSAKFSDAHPQRRVATARAIRGSGHKKRAWRISKPLYLVVVSPLETNRVYSAIAGGCRLLQFI
jgi:hypothetical protein